MIVQIVGGAPRFVLEIFAVVLLSIAAYVLSRQSSEVGAAIPILGVIALSVQRLLPLAQNSFSSWSSLQAGLVLVSETVAILSQPLAKQLNGSLKKIKFERHLRLEKIYFRYGSSSDWVLEDISFVIPKGAKVGVIGPTGGGKSTLLDILMGLLIPNHGELVVDGVIINESYRRGWQNLIAHVPQSIFLADTSIAENIAFGCSNQDLDMDRIVDAASKSELSELISRLPMGYATLVGERGVRLSGGQRQRIGLARAMYKNAEIVIFDEATSALDSDTEELITNSVNLLSPNITTFTVAHRLATLKYCDMIFKIESGRCRLVGDYREAVANGLYQNNDMINLHRN